MDNLHFQKNLTSIPFEGEEVPFDEYVTDNHRRNIRLYRLQSNHKNSSSPLDERDELNIIELNLFNNSFICTCENYEEEYKINDRPTTLSSYMPPDQKSIYMNPIKLSHNDLTNILTKKQAIINSPRYLQEDTTSQIKLFSSPLSNTGKSKDTQISPIYFQTNQIKTSVGQTCFYSSLLTLERFNNNNESSSTLTKLNNSANIISLFHPHPKDQTLKCLETSSKNVKDILKSMRPKDSLGSFNDDILDTIMELRNKTEEYHKGSDLQVEVLNENKIRGSYDTNYSEDSSIHEEDLDLNYIPPYSDKDFCENIKHESKLLTHTHTKLIYNDDSNGLEYFSDLCLSNGYSVLSIPYVDIFIRTRGILKQQRNRLSTIQPSSLPRTMRKGLSRDENNNTMNNTNRNNRNFNDNSILQLCRHNIPCEHRTKLKRLINPTSNYNAMKKRIFWTETMNIQTITTEANYGYFSQKKYLYQKGHAGIRTLTSVEKEQIYNDNSSILHASIRIISAHVITLQTHIRSYIYRYQYMAILWTICTLQSYCRRILSKIYSQVLIRCTKIMQRIFRGWVQRVIYARYNLRALCIQIASRRFLSVIQCQTRIISCVILQCSWRRYFSQTTVMLLFWNITIIQSFFRERIVSSLRKKKESICITFKKSKVYVLLNSRYRVRQIVRLQSIWRCYFSIFKVLFLTIHVIVVQCHWRKIRAIFYTRELRNYLYNQMCKRIQASLKKYFYWINNRKYLYCTIIQSLWRGFYHYVEYVYKLTNILTIQCNIRRFLSHKYYLLLLHIRFNRCKRYAIQILLIIWRGYSKSLDYITKLMQVLLIQSILRRYTQSKYFKSLMQSNKAVNTIQSFFRD